MAKEAATPCSLPNIARSAPRCSFLHLSQDRDNPCHSPSRSHSGSSFVLSRGVLSTTVMEFPLRLALRYLGSKKRASVSVGTAFATIGVMLGVAALSIVMSVTGGFQEQFREKVLGVN